MALPTDALGGKTTTHKVKEPENNDNVQAPDEKFWKQLDKKEKDDRRTNRELS
jgi:predicted HAD superfamily Cof-like phosphohydrolase